MNTYTNLSWQYYRNYFYGENLLKSSLESEATEKRYKAKNKALVDTSYHIESLASYYEIADKATITLQTTYPGLLVGAGYGHEVSAKGELKLGFFFDHSTGLPIIAGSSVKGVLRSAFPQWDRDSKTPNEIKQVKTRWIESLLTGKQIAEILFDEALKNKIHAIELAIFEGIKDNTKTNPEEKYYSIYERDIFFDAYISVAGKDDKILGIDSITPHIKDGLKYEEAMLKNPTPIPFLKVLPNVSFTFNFLLKDNGIEKAKKQALFQQILLSLGIGAKTNVGYGQFSFTKSTVSERDKNSLEEVIPPKLNLEKLKEMTGKIEAIEGSYALAVFITDKGMLKIKKKIDSFFSTKQKAAGNINLALNDNVSMIDAKSVNNENVFTIKKKA